MRQPVLYVAVCAVLMCGFQNPSDVRKNPPQKMTKDSGRAENRSPNDADSTTNEISEVITESSPPSKEALIQKLATLNTEFNAQVQAMQDSPSQELFLDLLQLKERILNIQAELHGDNSFEVVENLEWLADITFWVNDLDHAKKYQQWLINVLTQKYGKADSRVTDIKWKLATTTSLNAMTPDQVQQYYEAENQQDLGAQAYQTGEYADALAYFQQAAELFRTTLGMQHPYYATSLDNLAQSYDSMRNYTQAEPLYLETLSIRKTTLGEQHPGYGVSLNNLALLYESMGEYTKAEPLLQQAMVIMKQVLGEQHPDYAVSLNNLGLLYKSMGEYDQAEPLFQQSLDIIKTALGEQDLEYAISLNDLASLYESMGEYSQAEPLHLKALSIRKKLLGEQHPVYATSLNNLGGLYYRIGDFAQAEPLFLQALSIRKQMLGEQHPDYAKSLSDLAGLYAWMGVPTQAESLYLQALTIIKQVHGEQHRYYGNLLHNLALLYHSLEKYNQAEPLFQQALAIRKIILGEQHPDYASSLDNLALLYESMEAYSQAETIYQQALLIRKSALGEQHPDYAVSMKNLAWLYEAMGEFGKAEPLFRQALKIQTANLQQLSASQGEARSLVYQNQLDDFQYLLSCSRHLDTPDPAILYAAITESQGVISQLLQDRHELVLENPAALEKQQELRQLQRELATLVLAVPQPEQVEARQQRMGQLNQHKEDLEQELARLSEPFRRELEVQKTGLADLQRELNEQQALVHLILGWDYIPETKKHIPILDAFILRRDSLDWVQIPHSDSILELASTWRIALISGDSDVADKLGVKLREQLWQPIEEKLQGVETLYFVLDGELSFLPYAALPGREPGTILLEDYQLATVTHLRELYRQLTDEPDFPQSRQFLEMGAVDYDDRSQPAAPELLATTSSHRAPVVDRGATLFWSKLPGTRQEVERLTELWTEDDREQILIGPQASESELRRLMSGQAYVHLATHGFFANEKFRSFLGHDQEHEQLFARQKFLGDNPLSVRGPTVTERLRALLTMWPLISAPRPMKISPKATLFAISIALPAPFCALMVPLIASISTIGALL